MGSFQQISIGIVCLVAAFAFGNYVNNHPPGDHPHSVAENVEAQPGNLKGNVQSRLPEASLEVVQKRPAPIVTMRKPLKSRFEMPLADSTPANLATQNKLQLPPPSELGSKPSSASDDWTQPSPLILGGEPSGPSLDSTTQSPSLRLANKQNDIPDFTSIVSRFKNSPIQPPDMGQIPTLKNQLADPVNTTAKLKPMKPRFASPGNSQSIMTANPWTTEKPKSFSDDDFAPSLRDRLPANRLPVANHIPSVDPKVATTQANESFAEQYGFTYAAPPLPTELETKNASPFENAEQPAAVNVANFGQENELAGLRRNEKSSNELQAQQNVTAQSNHVVSRQPLPGPTIQEQLGSNTSATTNRTQARLPFGLNKQARTQLVAIKSRATNQLASNTTRFVDHVIQRGETLQSISKRYFGQPDYYLDIYLANRNLLKNPVDAPVGTSIRVPIYE